jgi:bacteriorhodopsin
MSEVKEEKDYFWFYIGGLVVAVVVVLLMVKGSEHDKYATAAKAIAEDSTNSSYKK